jgi:hypothetical protein
MVIYKLVAVGAEQHEVRRIVDIYWSNTIPPSRPLRLECHDVGGLAEVAGSPRYAVFKDVLIAAIKFAATARLHVELEPDRMRNRPPGDIYDWGATAPSGSSCVFFAHGQVMFVLCSRRTSVSRSMLTS